MESLKDNKLNRLESILNHYERNFGKNFQNHEILDWESHDAQRSRFAVLVECINPEGMSILDVGCGLADMYAFMQELGINALYSGVDISERMIEHAKGRFPHIPFHCADIFCGESFIESESFDIVFSSGIFNLNLGNNLEFLRNAICEYHRISSQYVIFNLLSDKSTDKEDRYFYYRQRDVEKMIRDAGFSSARIIEDYLLNDLTVVCIK